MTSINYNEFQAGQGVSAPDLNENFTLTNTAIENLSTTLNSAVTTLTSTTALKANKNGSASEKFSVANGTETTHAVNLGQLNSTLMPSGSIVFHAGETVPEGYLLCDGRAVSRTTYADLFTAIGVKYGSGDESTTFNLPNLINKYVKASDTAGTTSTNSETTSSAGGHQHSYSPGSGQATITSYQSAHSHNVNITNITLLPCIKS